MHRWLALMFLPLAAAAQQSPPPDVDQALRERVSRFFQYHVDGQFRKAYDLVAEDTKDYYFGAGKVQYKSFKIESIAFSENFTRAKVTTICERDWNFKGESHLVTTPVETSWKVEEGKWVWYYDPKAMNKTPMGPSASVPNTGRSGRPVPTDLSQKSINQLAQQILESVRAEPAAVEMPGDAPASRTVTIHNGIAGGVRLTLQRPTELEGFTAALDRQSLGKDESATLTLRYAPLDKSAKPPLTVTVIVDPMNHVLRIPVKFAPPTAP